MNLPIWIDNRAAELGHALRMIQRTPGAAAFAVLSLALGIGAITATFWLPIPSPAFDVLSTIGLLLAVI